MMNKNATPMERIIAKIDNDFNPDNSDWIPRVAAWTIDVLSILKVIQEETKTKQIKVTERIAYDKCIFNGDIVSITDENGCTIKEKGEKSCCGDDSFTGKLTESSTVEGSGTIGITIGGQKSSDTNLDVEVTKNSAVPSWYSRSVKVSNTNHNYVKIGNDKIELSYDAKIINVTYKTIKTSYSDVYCCEIPVIPNNGLLIECIVAWCMYKMLCRGYKHPVFTLSSNSPATNPYIFWIQNKDKAKDSVILDEQGEIDSKIWRSGFYIDTFDPRN